MAAAAYDDVVVEDNPDDLACPHQFTSRLNVCCGWTYVIRWVIVHTNHACRTGQNCGAEDFSWMHKHGIEQSERDDMMTKNAKSRVE